MLVTLITLLAGIGVLFLARIAEMIFAAIFGRIGVLFVLLLSFGRVRMRPGCPVESSTAVSFGMLLLALLLSGVAFLRN